MKTLHLALLAAAGSLAEPNFRLMRINQPPITARPLRNQRKDRKARRQAHAAGVRNAFRR